MIGRGIRVPLGVRDMFYILIVVVVATEMYIFVRIH